MVWRPFRVHFLGPVNLIQEPSGALVPLLKVGYPPKLLFVAPVADPDTGPLWDPFFPGGQLHLTWVGPDGRAARSWCLPLINGPLVTSVHSGQNHHLLRPLPDQDDVWRLPDVPGPWRLDLRWVARGREEQQSEACQVHVDPVTCPEIAQIWAEVAPCLDRPDPWEALEAALAAYPVERRLWVMVGQCRLALEARGDWVALERMAERVVEHADEIGLVSLRMRGCSIGHAAARILGALERAEQWLEHVIQEVERCDFVARQPLEAYNHALLLIKRGYLLEAVEAAVRTTVTAEVADNRRFMMAGALLEARLLHLLGHNSLTRNPLGDLFGFVDGIPAPEEVELFTTYAWIIYLGVERNALGREVERRLLDTAEQVGRRALEGYRRDCHSEGIFNENLNLAGLLSLKGDLEEAESCLREASVGLEGRPAQDEAQVQHDLYLARLERLRGQLHQALELAKRAEEAALAASLMNYAGSAAWEVGRVCRALGDLGAAQEAFDRALAWVSSRHEALGSPFHRADLIRAYWGWQSDAIGARLDRKAFVDALRVIEAQRARRLLVFRRARNADELTPLELAEVAGLSEEIHRVEAEAMGWRRFAATPAAYRRQRMGTEMRLRRLVEQREAVFGIPDLPVGRPQEPLSSTRPILIPEALRDELVVWSVDPAAGVSARRLPIERAEVEHLVRRFVGTLLGAPEADGEAGEVLASLLVPGAKVSAEGLEVVADGLLGQVPFGALPVGGRPLLCQLPVSYRLSAFGSPGPVSLGVSRPLVVADPTGTLPFARAEGEMVARRLGVEGLIGQEARLTRDSLLSMLAKADLLHFAGHAVIDPLAPMASYLELYRGERLSLLDLRTLRLNGRPTVILNACEAARSPEEGGGIAALSYAFLCAGASEVLAPLWPMPDEAGALFMEALYHRWSPDREGVPLAAAFHQLLKDCVAGHVPAPLRVPAVWSAWKLWTGQGTVDGEA